MRPRARDDLALRPCAPCGVVVGWRRRRSGGRSLRLRTRMLSDVSREFQAIEEFLTLLASMAVHVGLQRARAREALVADLALVLLLRTRRHLGAELAHHRLRRRRDARTHERVRPGQCPRVCEVDGFRGRAVVGHGALACVVVAIIRRARDGRVRRVRRREAIRVGGAPSGALSTVDVPGGDVGLAQRDHTPTGIEGVAEAVALWWLRTQTAKVN